MDSVAMIAIKFRGHPKAARETTGRDTARPRRLKQLASTGLPCGASSIDLPKSFWVWPVWADVYKNPYACYEKYR